MDVSARESPLYGRVGTENPKRSIHTVDDGTHAAHYSIVLHHLWLEACFCAQIIHGHWLSGAQRIASMRIGLHTQRRLANQLLREPHSRAYAERTFIWEEIEDGTIVDVKRLTHPAHHLVYEHGHVGIAQRALSKRHNNGLLQSARFEFCPHLLTRGDFALEGHICLGQHGGLCLAFLEEASVIERKRRLRGKAIEEILLIRAEIEWLATAQSQHAQ